MAAQKQAKTATAAAVRQISGQAPKKIAKPEVPDDLTQISGVGPKLQDKVNEMGVWTYRQIAEWKGQEIAYVNGFLTFQAGSSVISGCVKPSS